MHFLIIRLVEMRYLNCKRKYRFSGAKLAWESDQSRAIKAESKRKIEDVRTKLKMSTTLANDLKSQVSQLQKSQRKLQQNATETIESLQKDLAQLTRRNQDEVGVLQREPQSPQRVRQVKHLAL